MKYVFFLLLSIFFFNPVHASQKIYLTPLMLTDTVPKKVTKNSVQKEKLYCSTFAKTKYKVLITGNKVRITRLYKEYVDVINGIFKNGKIYSDDTNEKSNKLAWGKYYKLNGNSFSVLNIENGDYEWFAQCK